MSVVSVFGIFIRIFSEGKEMVCGYEIMNFLLVLRSTMTIVLPLPACANLTLCVRKFHLIV